LVPIPSRMLHPLYFKIQKLNCGWRVNRIYTIVMMKRYFVLCGLVFTALVRLDAGDHPKKDEGFQGGGLKLEEKGMSHNLAFLLRYADAVVLTKKLKYKTARYKLSVSEVVCHALSTNER